MIIIIYDYNYYDEVRRRPRIARAARSSAVVVVILKNIFYCRILQVIAHRMALFLLHLLPGPKMPSANKLNSDHALDALIDDPFGTQSQ